MSMQLYLSCFIRCIHGKNCKRWVFVRFIPESLIKYSGIRGCSFVLLNRGGIVSANSRRCINHFQIRCSGIIRLWRGNTAASVFTAVKDSFRRRGVSTAHGPQPSAPALGISLSRFSTPPPLGITGSWHSIQDPGRHQDDSIITDFSVKCHSGIPLFQTRVIMVK